VTHAPLVEALWGGLMPMQRLAWEQGVASQAALDSGRTADALAIARDAVALADADGRLAARGDNGLVNGGALGEAVALLASEGDDEAAVALDRQRWWFLRWSPRDDEGVVWHLAGSEEVWADSVYMVVPLLVLTGDVAPADMQYRMHREHLWSESTGLYGHRTNTVTGERTRRAPWASGNGWIAAGMARALHVGGEAVPEEMRGRWERDTRALLNAVATHETLDGRFHDVLDDDTTFTDGTAGLMFAYAAFTGIADGWLERADAERAQRWMDAALDRVDGDGVVRGVCGAPHFDREGTSAEAQGFGILALTASARVTED
jgi:unsaturated rhamnogalacturonyl hydrolase